MSGGTVGFPVRGDFMHLDNVAIRIVEENLTPALHRLCAPVGVRDAARVEMGQECGDVIGAIGDVSVRNRVHGLTRAKRGVDVLLGDVVLDGSVAEKGDIPAIPLPLLEPGHAGVRVLKAHDLAPERLGPGQVVGHEIDVVQLQRRWP